MSTETAWIAFQSLISLSIVLWLVFWGLPAYRVDRYRQELFEVRDRLFDYAAEGNIGFGHPAYGMLRSTINGFIRFAHRMSFCQIVLMTALNPRLDRDGRSFFQRWESNQNGLSPEVKAQLNGFLCEVNFHTGRYVLGCLSGFLLSVMKSINVAASYGGKVKQFLMEIRDRVDTTALVYGGDDANVSSPNLTTKCMTYILPGFLSFLHKRG